MQGAEDPGDAKDTESRAGRSLSHCLRLKSPPKAATEKCFKAPLRVLGRRLNMKAEANLASLKGIFHTAHEVA